MVGIMTTVQVVLLILTAVLAYNRLKDWGFVGNNTQNKNQQPGLQEQGTDIIQRSLDWMLKEQEVPITRVPNWLLLVGFIVFLYAIFRK